MTEFFFQDTTIGAIQRLRSVGVSPEISTVVAEIVADVRRRGGRAVREYVDRFGEFSGARELVSGKGEMLRSLDALEPEGRIRLERIASRIRRFAEAQREALHEVTIPIPGGMAGDTLVPVERVGCYAPGGRYPLPSSVLMTAITARVAGVREVWVASPRPAPITLAAAAVAGVDGFVSAGGAHAIAALAYGTEEIPRCDLIVGPGNVYVTEAKRLVAQHVGIDMLAGPSELVVLADETASPSLLAADLLAQAEHDDHALPLLVTTSREVAREVRSQLESQICVLRNRETARRALANGGVILVADIDAALDVCAELAPEHLSLHVRDAEAVARRVKHAGALFIGARSAEVLADYGAGPNHVLPTAGTARFTGGLSVSTFLRRRTWMRIDNLDDAATLMDDAAWMARMEGLDGHAEAAEVRREK